MWADYNLHFAVSLGLTELSFPLCLFLRGNSTQADSTTMPWRTNVGTPFGDVGEEHDTQASPGDRSEHLTGDWDTSLVDDNPAHLFCEEDEPGEASADGEVLAVSESSHRKPVDKVSTTHGHGVDDSLFFHMVKLPKPPCIPKQPWEEGIMGQVFGKSDPILHMPWLTLPTLGKRDSLDGTVPSEEPPEKRAARTPFHYRRLLATRLAQTDDQLRAKAMRRLRDLVLVVPEQSKLGRALLDFSGQLVGEDRISCVFADAFRSRATSTLIKRSMDFYKLAVWMRSQFDLRPMQLSEGVLYQYLSFLRETGAAPTSADATVKSVWFMHSTVGFIDFHPECITSRITGVCRDMFMRKRILKQAPAFPATVVRALEEFALFTKNLADSMFTNFILFCIYSSCRVGDASKISEVTFSRYQEVHLVEAATTEAKNTATMERRRMLLPFTAVGWGVFPNPWCIKWNMQLDSEKPATIMPAFSEVSGRFLDRRLTTAEANLWLKEILMKTGLSMSEACRFSTHSCKATIPTWAGKFGGFSMDERRMLTHHMDGTSAMPLTYSRDNLTALHSRVFRMLTAIRNYEFDPDATNAARIFRENVDLFEPHSEAVEHVEDWAGSETDVSGDENLTETPPFIPENHVPASSVGGDRLVHKESMVVHLSRDQQTLWCGRKRTANYREWQQGDPSLEQLLVCQQCDRSKP